MNNELEGIWKEAAVIKFGVVPAFFRRNSARVTKILSKTSQSPS
jgi:hypothetical protein